MGRPRKNEIVAVSKPSWNYDSAVTELKTMISTWAKKSVEMCRALYIAKKELSSQGKRTDKEDTNLGEIRQSSEPRTWSEFCNAIGLPRKTADYWVELYDPETDQIVYKWERKALEDAERDKLFEEVRTHRYNGEPDWKPEGWTDKQEEDYKLWLIKKGYMQVDLKYLGNQQTRLVYGDDGLFPESYVLDIAAKSIDRCSGDNAIRFMKNVERAKERVPKGIEAREVVRISEMAMAAIEMFPAEVRTRVGIICAEMLRDEVVEGGFDDTEIN